MASSPRYSIRVKLRALASPGKRCECASQCCEPPAVRIEFPLSAAPCGACMSPSLARTHFCSAKGPKCDLAKLQISRTNALPTAAPAIGRELASLGRVFSALVRRVRTRFFKLWGPVMRIRYGCDLTFRVETPTPTVCLVDLRPERRADAHEDVPFTTSPSLLVKTDRDVFGNVVRRFVAQPVKPR